MLLLVQIDLSQANLVAFESYEEQVLNLLPQHDGKILARLRAIDGQSETHLLEFSDAAAFATFKADPRRERLRTIWETCGASSTVTEVAAIS